MKAMAVLGFLLAGWLLSAAALRAMDASWLSAAYYLTAACVALAGAWRLGNPRRTGETQ